MTITDSSCSSESTRSSAAIVALVRGVTRDVEVPLDTLRVGYAFDDGSGFDLIVADGRIHAVPSTVERTRSDTLLVDGAPPDLWVLGTAAAVRSHLLGDGARTTDPNEVLAGLRVRAGDEVRWFAPSPLDDAAAGLRYLPVIAGADLAVAFRIHGTLAGTVVVTDTWRAGRRAGWTMTADDTGPSPEVDVHVDISLELLLAVRRGSLDCRQALEHGAGVAGDWPPMMLLVGLVENPDCLAAWRAVMPGAAALDAQVALGSVRDVLASLGCGEVA